MHTEEKGKIMTEETCPTCQKLRTIVRIARREDGNEEKEFSCGHKVVCVCVTDTITASEGLRLRKRSGEKDQRGKPIKEVKTRVEGDLEVTYSIDRSERLKGIPKTKVLQEVWKKGKLVHKHDKTKEA